MMVRYLGFHTSGSASRSYDFNWIRQRDPHGIHPKLAKTKVYCRTVQDRTLSSSVADPDPNPDPHVFGPPGSGSTSQRYGSGSGSWYHRAKNKKKIVRKTLTPTIL